MAATMERTVRADKVASVKSELDAICKAHRGILQPEDVVEFARDPDTALHGRFEWKDGDAADLWRLHQARNIIRVFVVVLPQAKNEQPTRCYVSLTSDRVADHGYRRIEAVLSHKTLRDQMLADAMAELAAFRAKYATLKELSGVFAAIDKLRK